jgi:hypothetical protein
MPRRITAPVAVLLVLLGLLPSAAPALAEVGYTLETTVDYQVDTDGRQLQVSIEATFTNTTPDANGRLSGFDRVELAVHPGAVAPEAEDADGPLTVTLATDGVTRAVVSLRTRVRYQQSAAFSLRYRLDDGAPGVHVRLQVVQFAAWAIGTSSLVRVTLPPGYSATSSGAPLVAAPDGPPGILVSGPIADPAAWAALVTATAEATFVTMSQSVALAGGTVDLQVNAWSDDPAWGRHVLSLLRDALPLLEAEAGLSYPRVGPLVVRESVVDPALPEQPPSSGAEILAAFDQPDFTLLHQAAHIWVDQRLAGDLWIREGLASHLAAQVAGALGLAPPYDPAGRAAELAAAAIPLDSWTAPGDPYGLAAAWALVDRISITIGEDRLRRILARVAAGVSAYDPSDTAAPGSPVAALDSRRLLDQLSAVSRADFAPLFAELVFGPEQRAELDVRAQARAAYAALLAAAGDLGAPEPARLDMAAWRFDSARTVIDQAQAWLKERDALVLQVSLLDLVTPDRLRDAYRVDGGGAEATAELAAARAVVDAYASVRSRVADEVGPIEQIGLLLGASPDELLGQAAAAFGAGDLQAATAAIDGAAARLDRATADGLVRISVSMLLAGLLGYLATRITRRSGGSDYTAAQ